MDEQHQNIEEQNSEAADTTPREAEPQSNEAAAPPAQADVSERIAQAEKQAEFYKDQLLRKVADFENFKKRSEAEAALVSRYARADILQELLPVIDDFERSLKLVKDRGESEAFAKGVELIYQKLAKFLQLQGVKEIESVGKEFDVHYHDALLQVPRSDIPPHTVIEVVDKGYMLDDRILRHAKVIVSTTPAGEVSSSDSGEPLTTKQDSDSTKKLES